MNLRFARTVVRRTPSLVVWLFAGVALTYLILSPPAARRGGGVAEAARACELYSRSNATAFTAIHDQTALTRADELFQQAAAISLDAAGEDSRHRPLAEAFSALATERAHGLDRDDLTALGVAQSRVVGLCRSM